MSKKQKIEELSGAEIEKRAREWLRLHDDPDTRKEMDAVIADLDDDMKRRVCFTAMRIQVGLPVERVNKLAGVLPKQAETTEHVTPAVAQADAQSDAGERMAKSKRAKAKKDEPEENGDGFGPPD